MNAAMLLILPMFLVGQVLGWFRPPQLPESRDPLVTTNLGQVRPVPVEFSSPGPSSSDVVFTYLGIPFAEPPVDGRRFQAPEPVQSWGDEVLEATTNPPACPQVQQPGYIFSEDCLFLNVYVPNRVPDNAPVMVFIHGGSLKTGSSTGFGGNPVPLAAVGEVIVVTMNYRLNIFGFFGTGDGEITPNLGLLDQRLALQWVYENIDAFGGDPEQVTLFGQSAGAISVGWHLLSAESRQYFQRVILQSGVPTNIWAPDFTSEESQQIEALVGQTGGCTQSVSDCLKAMTVEELLLIVSTIEQTLPTTVTFSAAIDGSFFTSDVKTLIQNGGFEDIDILMGTNRDEGTYVSMVFAGGPVERPQISRDTFALFTETAVNPLFTGLMESVYSEEIGEDGNYESALSAVFGDVWFTCDAVEFARQVSDAGNSVYMYRLTQEPRESVWERDWLGVTHGEDVQYVFGHPLLDDSYSRRSPDFKVAYYIIQMWANFAKSGDPNTPHTFSRGVEEWPLFTSDTEIYKDLNVEFLNGQNLRQYYCNFLENLLPQVGYLQAVAASVSSDASD